MPWLMDRPSPVPSPSGFVVKNGSNTWLASVSDIPGPSSITSTATPSSHGRARTDDGSRTTRRGDGLRRVVDEIDEHLLDLVGVDVGHGEIGVDVDAGIDPVGHELVAEEDERRVEKRPSAVGRRWCSCFRAKLSRFFTIFDARSASSRMTDSGSLRAAGTCGTSLRKSAKPTTDARGLLRSWAMPAMSCPMADSFSDWMS